MLFLMGGVAYAYVQLDTKLNKIDIVELDSEKVVINKTAETDEVLHGYKNIVLLGVDENKYNTDTIIIASINNDTKEVKLVSVYRDTYLNIGDDMYGKANSAYPNGGVEWTISMLNTNLDLDITDYVMVDFSALVDIVDELGGIEITVTDDEAVHLNNYCVSISNVTGKEYEDLPGAGTYLMNGVQATGYCRIRYTAGNDFKRTLRQREVIAKIAEKAKSADTATLNKIMDDVFPTISTSISKSEILSMGMSMLSYSIAETTGFPFSHRTWTDGGDQEVPVTLEQNVVELHQFLFENEDYTPSEDVLERSNYIINKTGFSEDSASSSENYQSNGEELLTEDKEKLETETETEESEADEYGE
jgi:LCP family protein required for cell wall assembly